VEAPVDDPGSAGVEGDEARREGAEARVEELDVGVSVEFE
jgi:hypothetical protein